MPWAVLALGAIYEISFTDSRVKHRSDGIHVLCYSEAWGQGGVETFLMSIFRRWQGKGFYFTLFSCWDWNLALDAELEALGIDRFTVFPDSKPGR